MKYHKEIRYIVTKPDDAGRLHIGDRVFFNNNECFNSKVHNYLDTYFHVVYSNETIETAEFELDTDWINENLTLYRDKIKHLEDALNHLKQKLQGDEMNTTKKIRFFFINNGEDVSEPADYFVRTDGSVWSDNYECYESQGFVVTFNDCIKPCRNVSWEVIDS